YVFSLVGVCRNCDRGDACANRPAIVPAAVARVQTRSVFALVLIGVEPRIGRAAPSTALSFQARLVASPILAFIPCRPAGMNARRSQRAETPAVSGNAALPGEGHDRSKTNSPFRSAPSEALKCVDSASGRSPVSPAPGSQKRCVR